MFANCPNPEVLFTYYDRYYDPYVSAQIVYGPVGIVYEEELDENGMLVQKPIPDGMTADEFRLKNAPMGISYLSQETWDNYLNMEPRAKLRVKNLEKYIDPFVPSNVVRSRTPSIRWKRSHAGAVRTEYHRLYQQKADRLAAQRRRRKICMGNV